MTWTRLSDDFHKRPGIMALGDNALRVHLEAMVWANQAGTDGRIPGDTRMLRRIMESAEDIGAVLAELLKSGLWEPAGEDYQIDWTDQEPAERVRTRRQANIERQDKFRERRHRHSREDHSMCDPRFCNALLTALVTPLVTAPRPDPSRPVPTRPVPTRPDPSRPEGQGTGGEREKSAEGSAEGTAAQPERVRRRAAHALPDTWQPTQHHSALAAEKGLELSDEIFRFRNHAKSKDRKLRDWNAGFNNWLANSAKYDAQRASAAPAADRKAQGHAEGKWWL